ncbi:MAG TPA: PspA/IM30 family protein [Verrucomicrobiales bacterium]|nr:PspA/IM30 family protein [Verrucomicrobiales bacterium]
MAGIGEAAANRILNHMEFPEQLFEQAMNHREQQIREAKRALIQCMATVKQTQVEVDQIKERKNSWEQQAEKAVQQERQDLAVRAMDRATENEQRLKDGERVLGKQQSQVSELKSKILTLEKEFEDLKRNRGFIIEHHDVPRMQREIQEAKDLSFSGESPDNLFARMKNQSDHDRFAQEAAEEVDSLSTGPSESEKREIEKETEEEIQHRVRMKLDAIKDKLKRAGRIQ